MRTSIAYATRQNFVFIPYMLSIVSFLINAMLYMFASLGGEKEEKKTVYLFQIKKTVPCTQFDKDERVKPKAIHR